MASLARHRDRVARQIPRAWDGELAEDVAIFDDSVLESLPSESAGHVRAIREALECVSESRQEDAMGRVAGIPRNSPLSEWRLFVRGLIHWIAQDTEGAHEAWRRLSPERRAGRIATAMMVARRSDLERVSPGNSNVEAQDEISSHWLGRLDDRLLYHAKLLRRTCIDRIALRVAWSGVRVPEEAEEVKLGPSKIEWLGKFAAENRAIEPDLVAALERVALGRAFAQYYGDMFDVAVKTFRGPLHDPRNRLLAFFYWTRFGNDRKAQKRSQESLSGYLTNELPRNNNLSEPLRQAIASQIHLYEAMDLIPSNDAMESVFFGKREDTRAVREHFRASIRAYPANRRAYENYVEWLESKLEDDELTKPKRRSLIDELRKVMVDWSRGLPEDSRPRLWLVDHLMETEDLEGAKPHVDWLTASRHDDPRIRATPWKWGILEAMRLCRRKAWLSEVPKRLEEARACWPTWLSEQWFPYLQAAWMLRSGMTEKYEEQRQQICGDFGVARDSLSDACMMLAAAQRMRVPSADLKPLRVPVDTAAKAVKRLPSDELLSAGEFFWDMQRAQLLYPAYRMHGKRLVEEMVARFNENPKLIEDRIDDRQIHQAILWCSEHRFCSDRYELRLPSSFSTPTVKQHPFVAAAKANAFIKLSVHWNSELYEDLAPLLREAAPSQRDPYYRYWFASLADQLDDVFARVDARGSGFGFFDRLFGFVDDDGDEEFDPNCDCPNCRAAKQRAQAGASRD
ncbi:hypothetical protein Pan216_28130 [Planctomycetes bacterium Pan216]|uniref:Uncharacterized protein n=1 Tax=Kolteria novifilia TaxID=2527975 RepID=A0A518B4Q3_9BACT|nr:hypothetical protein Pan216_28130 [Planctomycetes bacterium Pan216]